MQFSGLAECRATPKSKKLHPAIAHLWSHCLLQYPRSETKAYVRLPAKSLTPDIWFATYLNLMSNLAVKDNALVRLAGFNYRKSGEVDARYVSNLPVPNQLRPWSYQELFEVTQENIAKTWVELAQALEQERADLFTLQNADLDTGTNGSGVHVMWS
jgi:hypothetical protein